MSRERTTGQFQKPSRDAVDLLRSFPLEAMRQRRQWCGFQVVPQPQGRKPEKIPVSATDTSRKASSTDSDTWSTFDDAIRGLADGAYTAIGYALAGDVVGVDLDGERWVLSDGELSQEAQAVVGRCGSYAERSISGRGLHILLSGKLPGRGRGDNGAGVEVYATARFFIVTGRHVDGTPMTIIENQPAIDYLLNTYLSHAGTTESAEKAEATEDMASAVSAFSAVSVVSVEQIIEQTLPTKQGDRNGCVMRLARGMKFNAGMSSAGYPELKPIVRRWHDRAFAVIGTKDFDETWSDFIRAWKAARMPLFFDAVAWAMEKAKATPLPPQAGDYDSASVRLLVGMCFHLASRHHEGRFFLSSYGAGALLGVSHDRALRWLGMLCADEVIGRVERGNERRATRYRWIAGNQTGGGVDKRPDNANNDPKWDMTDHAPESVKDT